MKVHLTYYAVIREKTGRSEESLETNARTAKDLYDELSRRYHLNYPSSSLKVAINHDMADWKTPLKNNDQIAFIPPVAGGRA